MSRMEEMLELQDKAARLEKQLAETQAELTVKKNKLLDLTEKISELINEANKNASDVRHFRSVSSGLETDKKNLERERDRLLKENVATSSQISQLTQMIETVNKTLQTKEEAILTKEKQLQKKDELLTEKDQKIEEYRQQFTQLSEEKAGYQKEKFEFMEKLNNEKMAMLEKVGNLEKTIQVDEQKIAKLREKSKNAEDGLLGSSMEIEKLHETIAKLNEKLQEVGAGAEAGADIAGEEGKSGKKSGGSNQDKQKITELEARLADMTAKIEEYKNSAPGTQPAARGEDEDVFGKGTGTYKSVSALITHFKFKIGNTTRLLRLMVPGIGDLKKYNLLESLNGISAQVLKNVACDVDVDPDPELLEELKSSGYKLTDYKGSNVFALTVDNSDAALAVYNKEADSITGVYSNNEELTKLLAQAIMNAFIKGIKIN